MSAPLNVHTRRVQEVGYSTLTIALPKDWSRKMGVRRGDVLHVLEMPDGSLVIRKELETRSAQRMEGSLVVYSEDSKELERSVIALYETGYDAVRISGDAGILARLREAIYRLAGRLIGVEIVEEGGAAFTLEVVLDPTTLDFHRILDRMELLIRASIHDLAEYSSRGDIQPLRRVLSRDDEIDKLYFLAVRQASTCFKRPELADRIGVVDRRELLPLLYYAKTLERIGDTVAQLAMYLLEFKAGLPSELVEMIDQAFTCSIRAFRKGDDTAAQRLAQMHFEYFSRDPREILSSTLDYLTGNMLSLCLDTIEARVELMAVRQVLVEVRQA